jgi:uncharacterized protein (TIGR02147 family)
MRIFEFTDYKSYAQGKVAESKGVRGYRSMLAEAAGCKKSFISQVLGSHVHFTPDHAANLSLFWGHSEAESRYFLDLVLLARAGSPALRAIIHDRIEKARIEQQDLGKRIQWKEISSSEVRAVYYSSWYWTAVHVITGIRRYQTPLAIADRLELPLPVVESALELLAEWKIVRKVKDRWECTEDQVHLPRSSPHAEAFHLQWRHRALANIQDQDPRSFHYSLVFALSRSDFEKLREMMRQFLEQAHSVIGPSPPEDLACLTCDLFEV